MHILKPCFAMDRENALQFAKQRGFGVVIAADEQGPRGSHVPFVILAQDNGPPIAQVHFTAKNPLVALADGQRRFLLVVSGADAYISNDWYVAPDHVSTWLYEAVHLSGAAHLQQKTENRLHGDDLLADAEARVPKQPWDLARMEPTKREAMLDAIRVVDIVIDTVEGQSKLNQHKTDAEHIAIADTLALSANSPSRDLAAKMRRLRPYLSYQFSEPVKI